MQHADEALPDVHFSSTSDDDGDGCRDRTHNSDDEADVIFIEHLPAAKRRCDHQLRSASSPRTPPRHPALQVRGEVVPRERALDASLHAPQATQPPYSFTHYRRCSADVASALKAKDGSMLMTILASLHHHSEAHPPPIPSHKLRERLVLLASPAALPPFLSGAVVCPVASAIQELWSRNVGVALPKAKRKAAGSSKSKSTIKSKTKKVKTKKKQKTSSSSKKRKASDHKARWDGVSKEERRAKELNAGYVPCALAGCHRTFTSENGMLHHLRDKHHVLDPRLGKTKKAAPQCTDAATCANMLLVSTRSSPRSRKSHSSEQPPESTASPAPLPQIASVSNDSVGARLLRLCGWTGGGLGPEGRGIAGLLLVQRCAAVALTSRFNRKYSTAFGTPGAFIYLHCIQRCCSHLTLLSRARQSHSFVQTTRPRIPKQQRHHRGAGKQSNSPFSPLLPANPLPALPCAGDTPNALFCSFALFKILRFPNTKKQSLDTSCQAIFVHQARASAASHPAARATTGGKQLKMVQALSRQQARWHREGFATCRRGWCRVREAAPPQAELQLSSCRRRRPFEFGPRPFGTRDISTKAALSLGGVDLVVDGMKKFLCRALATHRRAPRGQQVPLELRPRQVRISLALPISTAVSEFSPFDRRLCKRSYDEERCPVCNTHPYVAMSLLTQTKRL
jgi:hypothetical protein